MSNSMFNMMMAKRYFDEQEARKRELAERQKAMAKKQNADSLKSMASDKAIKYVENKMADKAATSTVNAINSGVISNAGKNALTDAIGNNVSSIANSGGNAIKDAVSNNISNATTNGASALSNIGASAGTGLAGAAGGIAGNMAGGYIGDKLGLSDTGTEIAKGAGGLIGTLGTTAAINGALATNPFTLAIAVGKMVYDVIKGVKQKKAMKAANKAQTINAEADQEATNEAMQNIAEQTQATNDALTSAQAQPDASQLPSTILGYQKYLKDKGYSPEAIEGVSQGLNYGDKNVASWIDTYNENNPTDMISIPKNEAQVELAKSGELNKESFGDVVKDIMGQVVQGYNNGEDYKTINGYDKTGWNRVGRAAGIVESVLSNPYLQGAVAGMAYGKDGNSALYGLNKGWEFAQNKAKSDNYAKAMGMKPGILGGVSTDDYKAKVTSDNAIARTGAYLSNVNSQMADRDRKAEMENKKFKLKEDEFKHKVGVDNKRLGILAKNLGISEAKLKELIRMNDNKIRNNNKMTPYEKIRAIKVLSEIENEDERDLIQGILDEDDILYGYEG